jgi:ribosomal protein S20
MSKKERNRKIVKQNNRNRIINKRYVSTIKTLSKLFKFKIEKYKAIKN